MPPRQAAAGVLLLAAVLAACSAPESRPGQAPSLDQVLLQMSEQDGRACLRTDRIDGYAVLDDGVVSVGTRGRRHYLVTTLLRCHSLDSAMGIAFSSPHGDFCGGGRDTLETGTESCPARHVFEFTSREDALATFELARARRQALEQFPDP